ncbi:hypothetical protein J3F83DRAFT_733376 [Trichoderma novae-zelandiae]
MMWCLRIASFAVAGILFGQNVLAELALRNGVFISRRPTTTEPVTVTSFIFVYDSTLTETTSDFESTTTAEAETWTTSASEPFTETEAETFSSIPSTSFSSLSSVPTTFTTSAIRHTTTIATTPASFASSTGTASDDRYSNSHTASPASHSTHVSAAQIAGIAIGSGASFCLVAALFFFFGRRDAGRSAQNNSHRLSMRDVGAGLGTVKTKFGTVRGKETAGTKQQQQIEEIQGPVELPAELAAGSPAELPATVDSVGGEEGNGSTERQVDGLPYVFRPPVVKELDGASVVSREPLSPSPEQQQEEQQQQQQQSHQQQRQEAEVSPMPGTPGDNGGSALPRYEELDGEARARLFSWAAPESAYRPDKSWYEN